MVNVKSNGYLVIYFSMAASAAQRMFKPVMMIPHIGARQGNNPRSFNSELANMGFKPHSVS